VYVTRNVASKQTVTEKESLGKVNLKEKRMINWSIKIMV
jgi:hypothetical protein